MVNFITSLLIISYSILYVGLSSPELKSVTVFTKNSCRGVSVGLLSGSIKVSPPASPDEPMILPGRAGRDYRLILCDNSQCFQYGILSFEPGQIYDLAIDHCELPSADVQTTSRGSEGSGATTAVRFRASKPLHLEFKLGGNPFFRRVSVGMTSYRLIESLDTSIVLIVRLRAGDGGPVIGILSKKIFLKKGRKHFVEINPVGDDGKICLKIQDEGATVKP